MSNLINSEENKNESILKNNDDLYDQISKIYNNKNPASRLLYIARIKDIDENGEKYTRENIVSLVTTQIKEIFNKIDLEMETNCIIIFLDSTYCIVLMENINESIIKYISFLFDDIKNNNGSHASANIISFVEENPHIMIPPWYVYESNLKDGASYEYKDKPISEKVNLFIKFFIIFKKGWILYDSLCNLGRDLCNYIKSENDKSQLNKVRETMNNYLKYIPASDEMIEMTSENFIPIELFMKLYVDPVDLTLDDDSIYPYQWHLNV